MIEIKTKIFPFFPDFGWIFGLVAVGLIAVIILIFFMRKKGSHAVEGIEIGHLLQPIREELEMESFGSSRARIDADGFEEISL